MASFSHEQRKNKILDSAQLSSLREKHPGLKIAHCHGVFDVLHAGHLAYFESAKKLADILVVTVTEDKHVNKGPGRPHFNTTIRKNMIAALGVVDYVASSEFPTAVNIIKTLKPHYYVKGPDYKEKGTDPTGAIFQEEQAVESVGGKLAFTDDETHSSSKLINEFFNTWSEDQQAWIDKVKAAGGLGLIEDTLNKLDQLDVQVIGEPIVDSYIFCKPENISSKSPSISAKYLYEESYTGGSLAIAKHLSGFTKSVALITAHGGEPYFKKLLADSFDPNIELIAQEIPGIPTPNKTRYLTDDNKQRMFEITNLRADQWFKHSPVEFCHLMEKRSKFPGATIVADFGHGLFEGAVLEKMSSFQGFVALNVQTNSSNFGFNPFKKHKRFSYLSIDLKEARVAYHDRFTSDEQLTQRIKQDLGRETAFSVTLGHNGSRFSPMGASEDILVPAYADGVVDTIGAGDAYFALTSVLVKMDAPHVIIPFLGNIFAGLKTKIIGNKFPVTKAQLLKAATAMLK